jgi:diguanylate cyclase (GGDEF)-like protein
MTSNSFAVFQLIVVAMLASLGLAVLGRWLRTAEYWYWLWGWLALFFGYLIVVLEPWLPVFESHFYILFHLIGVAGFCYLLAQGCIVFAKMEDVKLYRVNKTHASLFFLLTILVILINTVRQQKDTDYTLMDQRFLWSGPWLIGYCAFAGWIITRYQSRWYLRKSNVLFVISLGILACLEVFLLGSMLSNRDGDGSIPGLLILVAIEPLAFFMVGLALHVLVMDGLVAHLEKTLVQVSKNSAKLRVLAERDPLTAVLNRHAFYSLVSAKRGGEAKQPLGGSVAVIDIDNLKPLNDKHGHQTGDAAIRAVAKAIRSVVRAEDLLFRWGGDEFLVILPHVNLEESRWRFQKLDDLLKKTPLPGIAHPVHITLSVGVSPFSSSNSLEKAIEEADERMYSRKSEKKKNQVTSQ